MRGQRDTRRSYDAVAERYAAEVGGELAGKPLDRALLSAFAEMIGDGPVLDVGCGPGHVSGFLRSMMIPTFALDLSSEMCGIALRSEGIPAGAADMTALPIRTGIVAGIVSLYAVIHLDAVARAVAYSEFARVLRPGGYALVAFHTSDVDVAAGGSKTMTKWWEHDVGLTFHYLDAAAESQALAAAGLALTARTDRAPIPGVEHASQRSYLLVRKAG